MCLLGLDRLRSIMDLALEGGGMVGRRLEIEKMVEVRKGCHEENWKRQEDRCRRHVNLPGRVN